MLRDDALWQALTPLIEAMKAFSAGLERQVDKPISAFTGKPVRPSERVGPRGQSGRYRGFSVGNVALQRGMVAAKP